MLITAYARDGLSIEDIARKKMGINPDTLYDWRKKYPQISEALTRGKEPVDVEVENKLHEMCMGFIVKVKEPVKIKEVKMKAGEGRIETERIEYAEREVYVPPNVVAQKYWLTCRKPSQWSEKREVKVESTNIFKNAQTIAALINNPVPDTDISEVMNDE